MAILGPSRLDKGNHTADTSSFQPLGATVESEGGRFSPNSGRLRRAQGRTKFNSTAPGSGTGSVVACEFNAADDKLVMFRGTGVYSATVGATGTFEAVAAQRELESGSDTDFTVTTQTGPITSTRFGDAHLIADGVSRPVVFENNNRARSLGVTAPGGGLTFANAGAGTFVRPTSVVEATSNPGSDATVQFLNSALCYDADQNTRGTLAVVGGDGAVTGTFAFDTAAAAVRQLRIIYAGDSGNTNGSIFSYANFNLYFYVSVDSGTNYTLVKTTSVDALPRTIFTYDIAGSLDPLVVRVRITMSGDASKSGTGYVDIYDISLATAGAVTPISTDTAKAGIRYAYSKIKKYERAVDGVTEPVVVDIESSLSPLSPAENSDAYTFSAFSGLAVTRTETFESDVTHWRLYRSVEGATNNDTLDIFNFSKIADLPVAQTVYRDTFAESGFPLDYQDPNTAPPALLVGNIVYAANDPPPDVCDVIGSFGGSALYASYLKPGQFWWSSPTQPDYVPKVYSALAPGRITAFVDIGVLLVFTTQSVQAYSYLPLASDSAFLPGREVRDVSKVRGSISRRGTCIFEVPGTETLVAFVSSDGIYTTNGAQMQLLSAAIDWPATISTAELASCELLHSPNERKLILSYEDADGDRRALYIYYARPGGVAFIGPRRWPADSTCSVIRNNRIDVYTSESGTVYLEEQGTRDAAALENADQRITWLVSTPQIYISNVGEKRRLNTVMLHTPSADNVTLTVTVTTRIDGKDEEPFTITLDDEFDFDGWKDCGVGRECESFRVSMTSSSLAFPGVDALAFDVEGESDVSPQRIAQ